MEFMAGKLHIRLHAHHVIIMVCWLLVNLLLYFVLGIKYATDTIRFDAEATAWLNGRFEPSYHFWYTGYIAILAISKLLSGSIYPSILFQYLLSFGSTILFYQGLCRMLQNKNAAFFAVLLIILYLPVQQWNTCLLTESIFISLVLLFIAACSISEKQKWLVLFIIAAIATTVRPNGGILFLTCIILYCTASSIVFSKKALLITGSISSFFLLFVLNTYTDTFYQFLLQSFNNGEIICGYTGWTVPMQTIIEDDHSTGSIVKISWLFFTHPLESMQLAIYRFIALWTDLRMYYSSAHNIFTGIFLSRIAARIV